MKQNVELNGSIENKSLIKIVPYIPLTNFNKSMKSQIAQMYLSHFGGSSNLNRPSTINTTDNRTKRNQSQEIQKNRKSEPLINLAHEKKNFLDEEYPSIVLHPRENRYMFERIKKNNINCNQQNPQFRCQSAQKESKRSMSFGSMIGINQSTAYNTNFSNSTLYKESTPTTNHSNYSDSLQISPLKKAKKVIISYKSGRSLSKSQSSFSELSQKVIKDINLKKQMDCWVKQNSSPYIEYQNTNQLLTYTKNSHFTNIVLKQSMAAASSINVAPIVTTRSSNQGINPLQLQQEQQEQTKQNSQNKQLNQQQQQNLIKNLQHLKQQQKTNDQQKEQIYYPIQPFQSKFKIIHQKKVLVKDVF
ncbi:hypothetical protein TTHERM_000294869 (macronuclear) [Tetrahymena thermophila SB210]|uniref:Uncharacterized protein n=1 Tax=Tetrahymena thermophila (strain SB210) TaxID=312017 RepID=W7XJ17_TETTS|nr:hypothetical protein TTHERM_000294869 [Tetrahymena thermophila SB210]EWS75121.1 hypothetical protein TTHERM_000294869 [Tetrahymena thermophila SB210]|eukprot:XP_012652359.1 hypothetical protein TTHERM_000294869 [Tetrahymena thermophila SB210]